MKTFSFIPNEEGDLVHYSMDTLEECLAAHRILQKRGWAASRTIYVYAQNGREYPHIVGQYSETAGWSEANAVTHWDRIIGRTQREGQPLPHVQIGWHKEPCTRLLTGSPVVLGCLKANGEPRDFLLCWESGSEDLKREKTTCHTRGI